MGGPGPSPIPGVGAASRNPKRRLATPRHGGPASALVAAHKFGLPWLGFELDPDYCRLARERLEREMARPRLFDPAAAEKPRLF